MWFKRKKYITEDYLKDNYINKRELNQTIKNIVRDAIIAAYRDHDEFWHEYRADMYSIATTAMKKVSKESAEEVINTEEFLDKIIDRIKRKQL